MRYREMFEAKVVPGAGRRRNTAPRGLLVQPWRSDKGVFTNLTMLHDQLREAGQDPWWSPAEIWNEIVRFIMGLGNATTDQATIFLEGVDGDWLFETLFDALPRYPNDASKAVRISFLANYSLASALKRRIRRSVENGHWLTEGKQVIGAGRKRRDPSLLLPISHAPLYDMLDRFAWTSKKLHDTEFTANDLWNTLVDVVRTVADLPLEKIKPFMGSVWSYGIVEETIERLNAYRRVASDVTFEEVVREVVSAHGGQSGLRRRMKSLNTWNDAADHVMDRYNESASRQDIGRRRPQRLEPKVAPIQIEGGTDVFGYMVEKFGRHEATRLWNLIVDRLTDLTRYEDAQQFIGFMQSEHLYEIVHDAIRRSQMRGSEVGDEISLLLAAFGRSALVRRVIQSKPGFKMVDEAKLVPGAGRKRVVREDPPRNPRITNTKFLNRLLSLLRIGDIEGITALGIWRETVSQLMRAANCSDFEAQRVLEHDLCGILAPEIINALDLTGNLKDSVAMALKAWGRGDIAERVRLFNAEMD